jgi:hypothetical protein
MSSIWDGDGDGADWSDGSEQLRAEWVQFSLLWSMRSLIMSANSALLEPTH